MSAHATSASLHYGAVTSMPKQWIGRILSGLTISFLLFDGLIKFTHLPVVLDANFRLGIPESAILPIGILELICTVLYFMPRTALLGAVLLTGYLGGATAIHVRVGDPIYFPLMFGVLVWTGLILRSERVRQLISQLYR